MDIKLTATTKRNITVVKKEIYFRGGIMDALLVFLFVVGVNYLAWWLIKEDKI